ncbi:MAG: hypothetical protein KKA84_12280 [Bacteroidetes bacterium]|nr:hypothetical protein [Bacteroidota bacterium]
MRTILLHFLASLLLLATLNSQTVKEVKGDTLTQIYLDAMDQLESMDESNSEAIISNIIDNTLPKINSPYERFSLYLWGLASESARLNKYEKTFEIMQLAQDENIYFPFHTGERTWPGFITELEKFDGFDKWLAKNEELRAKDQESAVAEYIVKLPIDYSPEKSYPLVLTLTGGFGSHMQLSQYWQSEAFDSTIVVYLMGSYCQGTVLRSYRGSDFTEIVDTYNRVVKDYAVDTTRLVMAGQSAGGYRSVRIAMEQILPVKALLLAFPVKPPELDEEKIKAAAERGVKASIFAGENDESFLKGQIELAYLFNRNELPTRFLVFPELGHWYPEDFGKHISKSLEFLLQD